ncbi:MAG: alcohol dehydrogenase catalytic domain-containing protein [Chloroflexi bacterium]|nr:alcohol dehydrogenase catalytic domain-containing protein [Chloroflexota bacterium]
MKALVFHEHGSLEQVTYEDVPTPEIGADEALVQIKAAALNRLDLWVLAGWPGLNLKLPHIMGSDGAGIVAEVGANVADFAVGDRVAINPTKSCGRCSFCLSGRDNMCQTFAILGEHVDGFFAEYAASASPNLLKMPDSASFAEAAAASLVYVTAWHSLIKRGGLQAGESVLIIGAGGGVQIRPLSKSPSWPAPAPSMSSAPQMRSRLKLKHWAQMSSSIVTLKIGAKPFSRPLTARAWTWWSITWAQPRLPSSLRALKKGGGC